MAYPVLAVPHALLPAPVLAPKQPAALPDNVSWRTAWSQREFRWQLTAVLTLIFLGFVPLVPGFYEFIQLRAGRPLADPLLNFLPRTDVSVPLFALMYGSSVLTLLYLSRRPALLLRGLWGYLFLQLLRIVVLWSVALEPPATLLPLQDPLMNYVFQSATGPITKDLFFSGHTSVATLLVLAVRGKRWRRLFGLAAVAVGVLVLVQRVHYTYDVLAAPLFAWAAYRLAGQLVSWGFKKAQRGR